jgi:hypothetical protein
VLQPGVALVELMLSRALVADLLFRFALDLPDLLFFRIRRVVADELVHKEHVLGMGTVAGTEAQPMAIAECSLLHVVLAVEVESLARPVLAADVLAGGNGGSHVWLEACERLKPDTSHFCIV